MRLFVIVLIILTSACSHRHPAPVREIHHRNKANSAQPISKQNRHHPKYVHVKKGDTLYSLGFSHNIDFKTLAKINHIKAPYRIYPGQKLKLVADKSSHVVKVIKSQDKPQTSKNKPTSIVKQPVKSPIKNPPASNPNRKPIQNIQPAPAANSRWIWPVKGQITSTFSKADTARKGIDIASGLGSNVYASNNGTVVYSGDGLRGYGELIIIKHSNNLLSAYAHNSKRLVKEGQSVKQGVVIAKTGKGTDGKPLFHFEIRNNGQPVNPLTYLPKQ